MLHSQRSSPIVLCLLTQLAFGACPWIADAQPTVPAGFEDVFVANVPAPTALATTPDGRLLILSQLGQLYVYDRGALIESPALDLTATVCAYRERGMLGLAVDPQFASNHFIVARVRILV
jgi:glucose/arabinose dehydrogenase